MHPTKTYELRITFKGEADDMMKAKESLLQWLPQAGVEEFVEGIIDDLDIDNEYTGEVRDFYGELGGDLLPVSVFKYSQNFLLELKDKLEQDFGSDLQISMSEMETSVWMEGWKESFKPIETKSFYIYPPWEAYPSVCDKVPLIIEPGMAFGTGQHATTMLCLGLLESFVVEHVDPKHSRLSDVGTGTGILALAAKKLDFKYVEGSDIDPDALLAAHENAKLNDIDNVRFSKGSVVGSGFDVCIANILFVVLRTLVEPISSSVRAGGYVVFSGVLSQDFEEMDLIANEAGLRLVSVDHLEGWAGFLYQKADQ
jgi:ribosomal protein L11 methyltransferase